MDPKLMALNLFLDAIGVDNSIETVDDRKRVQKAVYLGQLTGVDLGYRFGWYLMGPYEIPLERRLVFAAGLRVAPGGHERRKIEN